MASLLCAGFYLAAQSFSNLRPRGLDFILRHSPTPQRYLPETMAGGVALLDYNKDGLLDIFLVNGGKFSPSGDFSRHDPAYWNRLYRQNQDGSFTDVTAAAGLSSIANGYGMGVAVGDFDNDGYDDLYVTQYGSNVLYRNNRAGGFTDVTAMAGVAAGGWSASAGFFDYDNDGRPDLFVTRYLDWDISRNLLCGEPLHSYCRPDKYPGTTNLLFHNEGGGKFSDVSIASGIASVKGKSLGVAFNDYDGDGFADIFVANDGMAQFLFHNNGNGTFDERALDAGVALSDDGQPFAGMGVAFADYDNDGRPDILVTNLALEKYALYHNDGSGQFSYVSAATHLAALSVRHSGWGTALADFDNDGWKDIFAVQGHVLDNVEKMNSTLRYLEPPALLRNSHGVFEAVALTGLPAVAARGAAFGDLNNDGAMDVVISVLGEHPLVLMNRQSAHHWLTIDVPPGTTVRCGEQWAYATTAGSYLSASDRRLHFGLGSKQETQLEIHWPGGGKQILEHVSADRIVTPTKP